MNIRTHEHFCLGLWSQIAKMFVAAIQYLSVCFMSWIILFCLPSQTTQEYKTVGDCLSYFDSHGLVELPLPPRDDGNYHFPRVQPIDPIVRSVRSVGCEGAGYIKNSLLVKLVSLACFAAPAFSLF